MKHVPNIISIFRMVLSILLICFIKNVTIFLVIYIICGISDILDGYIARKTNTQSDIGARMDSIADLMMFGVIITAIILWAGNELLNLMPLVIAIVLIRCLNMIIAAYKYHTFAILHTWGNKITGFLLFIAPIFILFHMNIIISAGCMVALLSAVEECIIHITSNKLDLNKRSIFLK